MPKTGDGSAVTLAVSNDKKFKNMNALKQDMRKHPETYILDGEYSLIEERKFQKMTRPTSVKIQQTDLFKTDKVKA